MKPGFLIIKTGSAFPAALSRYGDFDDWFRRGIGASRFDFRCVEVDRGGRLPAIEELHDHAGVIVTGSPAMVSHRRDWSELTAAWLRRAMDMDLVPILGVCYGHQLMAHALGGTVGSNPAGRRMGTCRLAIEAPDDTLLVPLASPARVHVTHLEAVLQPPAAASVIATAKGDPNHALHFGGLSWGVQFHPEFDAAIMRCYVKGRAELLEGEGFDSQAIYSAVEEAPAGDALLEGFAALCESNWEQRNGPIA